MAKGSSFAACHVGTCAQAWPLAVPSLGCRRSRQAILLDFLPAAARFRFTPIKAAHSCKIAGTSGADSTSESPVPGLLGSFLSPHTPREWPAWTRRSRERACCICCRPGCTPPGAGRSGPEHTREARSVTLPQPAPPSAQKHTAPLGATWPCHTWLSKPKYLLTKKSKDFCAPCFLTFWQSFM